LPQASNQYRIDGEIITNARALRSPHATMSAPTVQEVAIQTSNFNAEYGSVSGALFNQIIKSGTTSITARRTITPSMMSSTPTMLPITFATGRAGMITDSTSADP
jgi:hypothetical protein